MYSPAEQEVRERLLKKLRATTPGREEILMHNIFLGLLEDTLDPRKYPREAVALNQIIALAVAKLNITNLHIEDIDN